MGNSYYDQATTCGGWIGKIDAPLEKKLNGVKWGEYKLGDLFDVLSYKKRFDANKVTLVEKGGFPYIVRQSYNNGQKGCINEDVKYLNVGNTISFGQDTATMFYQKVPYFTGDKIKILYPRDSRFSKDNSQFFLACMRQSFKNFSWGSQSFSINVIGNQSIYLPQTSTGEIDFAFMENFVHGLEESRIRELKAYLKATGLTDYTLTDSDKNVLENINNLDWKEYSIVNVFNVKNTHNILSSEITPDSGNTPYLCASAENNGVSSYISYDTRLLERGNCIFIGGKTFVVSYQSTDFFSNDSHNLALYIKQGTPTRLLLLALATCVNKSLCHQYTWGDSVSKAKIKTDKITLPSTSEGKPDWATMETIISAVQKLAVADVVHFADRRIAMTRKELGTSNRT